MKKLRFNLALVVSVAMALSLVSCENDLQAPTQETDFKAPLARTASSNSVNKLDASVVELAANDAATVAGVYLKKNALSRSDNTKSVKNIVTINDSTGNPAIYVVNFEDGYIMVSATQKYYPVLAEVEHGTFTMDVLKETGMGVLVDEMVAEIKVARSGKYDFKAKTYWRDYVENGPSQKRRTRLMANSEPNDDYWAEYDRWMNSDGVKGNNVYYLHECFDNEILPEDAYNRYVSAAQDEDLWEGTEYSWWWTAYVVEKKNEKFESHGPLLTTKWHQRYPYNITKYDYLGCVTIATAQIMKYFRHPTIFNWDNMPDSMQLPSESPDLVSFLAELRKKLDVSDEGASDIGKAEKALKNYGFSVFTTKHNDSEIINSLKRDYPVYAEGLDSNGKGGHAWVIDGLEYSTCLTEYVLYRLADNYYPYFCYQEAQCYERYHEYSSVIRYHYNWGWGGNQNCWSIHYGLPVLTGNSTTYNFTKDRKELIITGYK